MDSFGVRVDSLLEDATQRKNTKYSDTYASNCIQKTYIPVVITTAGRIHGEFFRLFWIFADCELETRKCFENLGPVESPSAEAFKWKRAFIFNKNKALIARMLAQATTLSWLLSSPEYVCLPHCLGLSLSLSLTTTTTHSLCIYVHTYYYDMNIYITRYTCVNLYVNAMRSVSSYLS